MISPKKIIPLYQIVDELHIAEGMALIFAERGEQSMTEVKPKPSDLTVYYCPICDYYWEGLYINDTLPKCPHCSRQINKRLENQVIDLILKEGNKAIKKLKDNPIEIEIGSERDFEYI